MVLSLSHGLRTRQWLAFLKGWLSGKRNRLWASELAGDYAGETLGKAVHQVALDTVDRLKPEHHKADRFDDVLAYKQELDRLGSLHRDLNYSRRSRRWLWERAAHSKAAGHFAEWTAYARRNPSDQVMVAARMKLIDTSDAKLKDVIGNGL